MKLSTSIWDSLEISCISRDLNYNDYLHFHKAVIGASSAPLCKDAYETLYKVFAISMEDDFINNIENGLS